MLHIRQYSAIYVSVELLTITWLGVSIGLVHVRYYRMLFEIFLLKQATLSAFFRTSVDSFSELAFWMAQIIITFRDI